MTDVTGRKTGGRAKGSSPKRAPEQGATPVTASHGAIKDLTPEQIDAMGPREVLIRAMRRALWAGGDLLAVKIAMGLMPYDHAKKTSVPEQDPDAPTVDEIANDPDPEVKE